MDRATIARGGRDGDVKRFSKTRRDVCFGAGYGVTGGLFRGLGVDRRVRSSLSRGASPFRNRAALLVAVPVLLGSLARLPIGMLADRFGGRLVFTALMLAVCLPAFLTPLAASYPQLLTAGFFLGLAGASFAVGVGFVSRWFSAEKQGGALGVYGLGNIGQSAAVFLGPLVAAAAGWQNVFRGMAVLLAVWAMVFWLLARNSPVNGPAQRDRRDAQGAGSRTIVLGAGGVLLPDVRRIRRLLDLPSKPPEGRVPSGAGGRGIPYRWIRRARDAPSSRGRVAFGPDRRGAGALGGVPFHRAVCAASALPRCFPLPLGRWVAPL